MQDTNIQSRRRTLVPGYHQVLQAENEIRSFFTDIDPADANTTLWDATVGAISNPQSKYQRDPWQRDYLMMMYKRFERLVIATHALHGSKGEVGAIREQPEGLQDVEDFLALFAHETTSQLSAINIACDATLENIDTMDMDTLQYYLSIIRCTCHNMQNVMGNMLSTVTYRKGIAVPLVKKSSFLVSEWLPQWVKPFELMATSREINFEQHIHYTDIETPINTDKEKIEQILCNLLTNAFRYTAAGRKVLLMITLTTEQLTLQVKDEGSGIPAALAPLLFQPYQLTDIGKGGTGLGLYICKLYSDLLGASIQTHTRANSGTSFTVDLPLERLA